MNGDWRADDPEGDALAEIVRSAADAIIGKTLDGTITTWNPGAERLYGWTAEEALGQPISLIVPPDRMGELQHIFDRLRRGEDIGTYQTKRHRKDGTLVDVSLTVSPLRDRHGNVVGASAIARDITRERRNAERTARLLEVTAALADALETEAVLAASVELGVRALEADGAVLVLTDRGGKTVRLAGSAGYDGEFLASWVTWDVEAAMPVNDAIRTGQLIVVESAAEYERRYEGRGPMLQPDTQALVAVPLVTEGRPMGALGLRFAGSRRFDAEDRDYLRSLGGQCAIALERARLFEAERKARDRLVFLSRAGESLAGTLDVDTILSTIAELAVPRLADWCGVTVVQDDRTCRRFGIHHVDPHKRELARRWWEDTPIDVTRRRGAPEVIRTGQPEITPVIDADATAAFTEPDELAVLRELGLTSSMVVPLVARGRTLGAVTFVMGPSGRRYEDDDDLTLAQELARRAALAADNARLFSERAHVARKLQESLLPQVLPDIPGAEVAARYLAAGEGTEVGGDFYDVFPIGGATWAIVIGDVCGKGADAAGVTALARYTVRALAPHSDAACEVLAELNDAIVRQIASDERFLTAAYAILRPAAGGAPATLTVCLAGHPPPLVAHADGTVEAVGKPGSLLGVFAEGEFDDATIELCPGDTVVFYTDGVIEARNEEGWFGEDRLRSALSSLAGQPASHVAASLARAVAGYRSGATGEDDMAVLVVRLD